MIVEDDNDDGMAKRKKVAMPFNNINTSRDHFEERRPLHVEVVIHSTCPTPLPTLREMWKQHFSSGAPILWTANGMINITALPDNLQKGCVRACVYTGEALVPGFRKGMNLPLDPVDVHTFMLSDEEVSTEELEPNGGDDEWTAGCDSLTLPHSSLDGLWENLIFESTVKRNLLDYAQSALLFSDKAVSSHIVNWNRILMLYGPPGTGKTSLCRALAQKIAIRMGHRFTRTTLLEIHSHSLFSKWFSTSGKLVNTLFQLVREMVQDDPNTLICVLIDEVESLASSRGNTVGDPSDAMRAVNSLLTSLDRLRSFPNVVVLTTTNLTSSVDAAFVDRVDMKIHIDVPILEARYEILRSCLNELQRVGITITPNRTEEGIFLFPPFQEALRCDLAIPLVDCAHKAQGLSGRSLRRLPLQAHARFLSCKASPSVVEFVQALSMAIDAEHSSKKLMESH